MHEVLTFILEKIIDQTMQCLLLLRLQTLLNKTLGIYQITNMLAYEGM